MKTEKTKIPSFRSSHKNEEEKKTYRDSTPFGIHFSRVARSVYGATDQPTDVEVTNLFYSSKLIKHLITLYMPLAPCGHQVWEKFTSCYQTQLRVIFKTITINVLQDKRSLHAGSYVVR